MPNEKRGFWSRIGSLIAAFPEYYPKLLDGVIGFGDVLQALAQTLIIALGLPLILILMLIVEHHGIYDGLLWFLADENMASLGALAFVLFNLGIEFQIAYIEDAAKYKRPESYVWSAALAITDFRYRIGASKKVKKGTAIEKWQPRKHSPAHRFHGLRGWVTVAIFVLALSGRMHDAILKVSVINPDDPQSTAIPLAQGISNLLTQSSLADAVAWGAGTLFTMVALVGVQGLTYYIAVRVIDIREDMKKRQANQKAQVTRARNRVSLPAPRRVGISAPHVEQRAAYAIVKVIDNTLKPIKLTGGRYQCPACGKEMTRQGWGKPHGCRVIDQVAGRVDDGGRGVAPVDERLRVNWSTNSQPPETDVYLTTTDEETKPSEARQ